MSAAPAPGRLELGRSRPCRKCGTAGYLAQNGKAPRLTVRGGLLAELRRANGRPDDLELPVDDRGAWIPPGTPGRIGAERQRFYRCGECGGRGFVP